MDKEKTFSGATAAFRAWAIDSVCIALVVIPASPPVSGDKKDSCTLLRITMPLPLWRR